MQMIDRKHLCTFITLLDQRILKFLCLVLNFQKIMKFLCLVLTFGHDCSIFWNFYHKWRPQTWKIAYVNGWGDLLMLPFRAKRISVLYLLAHNGSGVFGAKQRFLASMSCVKFFWSTLWAMSFQEFHWLQKLGSCKASFWANVV